MKIQINTFKAQQCMKIRSLLTSTNASLQTRSWNSKAPFFPSRLSP